MTRAELTERLLDTKRAQGWSWAHIHAAIGGVSPILITAALLGQMRLPTDLARRAGALFGLSPVEERMLTEPPYRGCLPALPPTDPLIYRFYELLMVYGTTWKELIQEEFGDGIMSAIDFDMTLERQKDNKGDRVKLTLSGKFLPYKYFGAEDGVPANGLREA